MAGGGDSRYSMVFRLPSNLTIKNAQNHTYQKNGKMINNSQ